MDDKITDPRAVDYDILPNLLGYQLRRAHLGAFQTLARHLQSLQITPTQFAVVALVGANKGLTQRALAAAVGTDQSTLVSLLDKLQARGWLGRRRSEHDRRYHVLTLTADGASQLRQLKRAVRRQDAKLSGALSADERATLMSLLRRVNHN